LGNEEIQIRTGTSFSGDLVAEKHVAVFLSRSDGSKNPATVSGECEEIGDTSIKSSCFFDVRKNRFAIFL
jgi:hypothetical protein